MGVDETNLIKRSVNGDHSAYQLLLDQHLPSLSRYVARMMANSPEAEDIVQETFIRLWTEGHRYNPDKAKLNTWLHHIAYNLCIDHFRKHNRLLNEDAAKNIAQESGPDINYDSEILEKDIGKALMRLPERQRSAVIMCHYQGLSNRDAANILAVSVDALESLLSRARKQLRQLLALNHPGT